MGLLDKKDDITVDFNEDSTNIDTQISSDLDDFSFDEDTDVQSNITLTEEFNTNSNKSDDELQIDSTNENKDNNLDITKDTTTKEESAEDVEKVPAKSRSRLDIKKLGHSLLVKMGKAEVEEEEEKPIGPPKDLVLYMIMDKINATTLEYFRAYGIKVSKIFTNIKEAQDVILMQIDPFKLVIVDTGTGRFSSMGSRKEILDAISLCEDSIDVFYTDTAIKSELNNYEALSNKNINWITYKSTADILAHLLSLHDYENYIYDEYDTDDISGTSDDILNITGLESKAKLDRNIYELSLDISDIKEHIENGSDEDMLESYDVKI